MKKVFFISIFITAVMSLFALTTWEGDNSQFWNDADNWDTGSIPDNLTDVYIPAGTTYDPRIAITDSECRNITVGSGALLIIYDESLTVNEDMNIYGELEMTQNTAELYVNVDIFWESGSTANIVDNSAEIWVRKEWWFNPGSNVHLDSGYVEFDGDENGYIINKSTNSYFNHVRCDKEGWAAVFNAVQSTEDFVINGNLYNYADSEIRSLGTNNIVLRGSFNHYAGAEFYLVYGTFIFDGTTHEISLYGSDRFNNIVISSSGNTSLNTELRTSGDILIESGTLVTNNHTIKLGGNWTNTVGEAGFDEGTGRVLIWGDNYPQYCNSNETFYELELDKTFGENFYIDGYDVTCTAYDWTIGAIVVLSGSFTANSLIDNGISGKYYLYSGGTINLNNSGSWVDLNGALHIYGGTMNVAGSISEWPYSDDALIEMSGGVLDFTECGVNINTSHDLTSNITGGTLRTVGDFTCSRTDWNPTGGTLELYGLDDADLSMSSGSNFYDVRINKAVTDGISSENTDSESSDTGVTLTNKRSIISDNHNSTRNEIDRDGNKVELTRTNQVNVSSQLVINGNLYIDTGTFYLADYAVDVRNDLINYGNLDISGFLYIGDDCHYHSGSNVDLTGNIENGTYSGKHGASIHYSGSTFNQTDGYYYVESIRLENGCQYNGYDREVHIYVDGHSLENVIEINDPDSYFHEFYVDSGANASLLDCSYDLSVNDHTHLHAPLNINDNTLNTTYMDIFSDGNLIIGDGGIVNVTGNGPYFLSGGTLTMVTGSTLDSGQNIFFNPGSTENVSGGEIYLEGDFTDSDNIFNPTGGNFTFDGNTTSTIYGPTVFHNLTINKQTATDIVYPSNDMDINGNFAIYSGLFDTNGYDMNVAGSWTNNVGDAGFAEATGTVTFDGSYNSQITTDETFYNLTAANPVYAGWKVPKIMDDVTVNVLNDLNIEDGCMKMENNSVINVDGDLTILNDAGLDLSNANDQQVNINGNWINSNTTYTGWIGFSPGFTSTVTFNGSFDQFLTTDAPQEEFCNLVIDKSEGEFRSNDNIHVMGDLDLISGVWHDNVNLLTHYFEGDFYVTAGSAAWWNSLTGNTVVFTGTEDQTLYNPAGFGYFRHVIIDKTTWSARSFELSGTEVQQEKIDQSNPNDETRALTVTLTSNIDTQNGGILTIDEGVVDLNGNNLYTTGNVIINDGGKIIVDEGAQLQMWEDRQISVNNGGTLELLGNTVNPATVTHRGTGYYGCYINPGGTISAEHAVFEYMNQDGIYVTSGAVIDPDHHFDSCIFRNGIIELNAALLAILSDDVLTIEDAEFSTFNADGYNVRKGVNNGHLTFVDAAGDFSGEDYDWDPFDLIDWEETVLVPIDDLTISYNSGTDEIELTWTYTEIVDQFRIYRSTDPFDFSGAEVFTTTATEYSELATDTKYFYYVTAEIVSD